MKQTIRQSSDDSTHLIMEKIESVNQLLNEIEKTIFDLQSDNLSARVKNLLYNSSKQYTKFIMGRLLELKTLAMNYLQSSVNDDNFEDDSGEEIE